MNALETLTASPASAAAFDGIAESYDRSFTRSLIGRAQRRAVWRELDLLFQPGRRILEVNCGTGVDAAHLAERRIEVLACDAAPRMVALARRRLAASPFGARVEFRTLAIEEVGALAGETPFDGAFSNFGGLNCVEDLPAFAAQLRCLLRPGAKVLLCLLGPCCAWEVFWSLGHGNLRKALRRFSLRGTVADLGNGASVLVHYPAVRMLARRFAPGFRLVGWKGVGVTVPPSFVERWAKRHPKVLSFLEGVDQRVAHLPLLRGLGDHIVVTLERIQ